MLPGFDDTMMVYDSAVHEIDAISYFLEEPVVSVQTVVPRSTELAPEGLHDPLLFVFRTESGVVVTDELWVSTNAGYEVRTELVGSKGASTIGQASGRVTTQLEGGRWGGDVPLDFRPRFVAAYDAEVQAWINAVADGSNVAPALRDRLGRVRGRRDLRGDRTLAHGRRRRCRSRSRHGRAESRRRAELTARAATD